MGSEGKQGRFWGVLSRGPRSLIERLDREGGWQEGGSPGRIRVSGLSCWLMVVPLAVRGDSGLGNTLGRITYLFKTLVFFSPKMEKMTCGLQLIRKLGSRIIHLKVPGMESVFLTRFPHYTCKGPSGGPPPAPRQHLPCAEDGRAPSRLSGRLLR